MKIHANEFKNFDEVNFQKNTTHQNQHKKEIRNLNSYRMVEETEFVIKLLN